MRSVGVEALVYDAGRTGTERYQRRRCLERLVDDVVRHPRAHVVFDLDVNLRAWDRQQMIELLHRAGAKDHVAYDHAHRHDEVMLGIPDMIAWCWAAGGEWRRVVQPLVRDVHRVG